MSKQSSLFDVMVTEETITIRTFADSKSEVVNSSVTYENFYTPYEAYFVQATYAPRACDVPATLPWRISDISVFVWNFTFVCTAYQDVRATYM